MAWEEVFTALQQGVIDGGDNPVIDVVGMRFTDVVKRITKLHYTALAHPLLISEKFFQKLPKDLQDVVIRAGREATDYIRWWAPLDEEKVWWAGAKDAGATVTAIADESEWIKRARAIWPRHYDKVGGKEVVDKVMAILEPMRQ